MDDVSSPTPNQDLLPSLVRFLADTPDGDAVATAICRGALADYVPRVLAIHVLNREDQTIQLVGHTGLSPEMMQRYANLPINAPLPICEAFRRGTEFIIGFRQSGREYPMAAPYLEMRGGDQGDLVDLPLVHRGTSIGVIVIDFAESLDLTWELRSTFDTLKSAVTLWAVAHMANSESANRKLRMPPELKVTNRQRRVLSMLRTGRTTTAIAAELGYSHSTIKADIRALSLVLGAHGRADLITKADLSGL